MLKDRAKIKCVDEGIWRRIKLIPFTVTILKKHRDKELTKKPIAENSGVFNWLLAGYDMDSVGTFVNEALILCYIWKKLYNVGFQTRLCTTLTLNGAV